MNEVEKTEAATPGEAGIVSYLSPPPPRDASPRRMFMYLLPAAICFASGVGWWMIEHAFPNGDSRNFTGAGLFVISGLFGAIYGIMAVGEAFRPKGLRALWWALRWSAVLAIGPCIAIWALIRFGLLKHV